MVHAYVNSEAFGPIISEILELIRELSADPIFLSVFIDISVVYYKSTFALHSRNKNKNVSRYSIFPISILLGIFDPSHRFCTVVDCGINVQRTFTHLLKTV